MKARCIGAAAVEVAVWHVVMSSEAHMGTQQRASSLSAHATLSAPDFSANALPAVLLDFLPAGAVSVALVYYYFDDNMQPLYLIASSLWLSMRMHCLLCCCAAWLQVL
jgi:hypothetical protein